MFAACTRYKTTHAQLQCTPYIIRCVLQNILSARSEYFISMIVGGWLYSCAYIAEGSMVRASPKTLEHMSHFIICLVLVQPWQRPNIAENADWSV